MLAESLWGIDLGGTKVEGVILNPERPTEPLLRTRIPTEAAHGYEHIIGQITKLVHQMKAESGLEPECIGIGIPGTIDKTSGLVKNANTTCLIGKPFLQDLERILGISITMTNDANCFALAETKLGSASKLGYQPESVFGIIMGTGVGAGLVIRGEVINGLHGIAGEWGHNQLVEGGEACYCGSSGCLETIIAGPSLEKYYESITGKKDKLKNIAAAGMNGSDAAAVETLNRLVSHFGKAVSTVINLIDPDVIVLGGGVSNIDWLYSKGPKATLPHVFNDVVKTPFLRPSLGDSAGVFGAAMLCSTAPTLH